MKLKVEIFHESIYRQFKKVSENRCQMVYWPDIQLDSMKVRLIDGSFHPVDSDSVCHSKWQQEWASKQQAVKLNQ
jgi:hypothetical protein